MTFMILLYKRRESYSQAFVIASTQSGNGIVLKLVVVIFYPLSHLLQLLDLLLIVLLVFWLLCGLLVLRIFFLLHSFEKTGPVGDPTIAILEDIIPNIFLFNAEIVLVLSSKIENVINVVKFVMSLTHMLLEPL